MNTVRTLTAALVLATSAISATIGTVQAYDCDIPSAEYRSRGPNNIFLSEVNGNSQVSANQVGGHLTSRMTVTGDCGVALTDQTGFGGTIDTSIVGDDFEYAVIGRGDANIDADIHSNGFQGYIVARDGDVDLDVTGDHTTAVIILNGRH